MISSSFLSKNMDIVGLIERLVLSCNRMNKIKKILLVLGLECSEYLDAM